MTNFRINYRLIGWLVPLVGMILVAAMKDDVFAVRLFVVGTFVIVMTADKKEFRRLSWVMAAGMALIFISTIHK